MKIQNLALALIATVAGCSRQEEPIIFASKAFYDSGQSTGNDYVYIAGTLTGDDVMYKNNSVAFSCYKDRMECLTYSVWQIGQNQIGRLDSPDIYSIREWSAHEIVAIDSVNLMHCRKFTITIARKSQAALLVGEPINQSRVECKNSETRILKWTIEEWPGQKIPGARVPASNGR